MPWSMSVTWVPGWKPAPVTSIVSGAELPSSAGVSRSAPVVAAGREIERTRHGHIVAVHQNVPSPDGGAGNENALIGRVGICITVIVSFARGGDPSADESSLLSEADESFRMTVSACGVGTLIVKSCACPEPTKVPLIELFSGMLVCVVGSKRRSNCPSRR